MSSANQEIMMVVNLDLQVGPVKFNQIKLCLKILSQAIISLIDIWHLAAEDLRRNKQPEDALANQIDIQINKKNTLKALQDLSGRCESDRLLANEFAQKEINMSALYSAYYVYYIDRTDDTQSQKIDVIRLEETSMAQTVQDCIKFIFNSEAQYFEIQSFQNDQRISLTIELCKWSFPEDNPLILTRVRIKDVPAVFINGLMQFGRVTQKSKNFQQTKIIFQPKILEDDRHLSQYVYDRSHQTLRFDLLKDLRTLTEVVSQDLLLQLTAKQCNFWDTLNDLFSTSNFRSESDAQSFIALIFRKAVLCLGLQDQVSVSQEFFISLDKQKDVTEPLKTISQDIQDRVSQTLKGSLCKKIKIGENSEHVKIYQPMQIGSLATAEITGLQDDVKDQIQKAVKSIQYRSDVAIVTKQTRSILIANEAKKLYEEDTENMAEASFQLQDQIIASMIKYNLTTGRGFYSNLKEWVYLQIEGQDHAKIYKQEFRDVIQKNKDKYTLQDTFKTLFQFICQTIVRALDENICQIQIEQQQDQSKLIDQNNVASSQQQ